MKIKKEDRQNSEANKNQERVQINNQMLVGIPIVINIKYQNNYILYKLEKDFLVGDLPENHFFLKFGFDITPLRHDCKLISRESEAF